MDPNYSVLLDAAKPNNSTGSTDVPATFPLLYIIIVAASGGFLVLVALFAIVGMKILVKKMHSIPYWINYLGYPLLKIQYQVRKASNADFDLKEIKRKR